MSERAVVPTFDGAVSMGSPSMLTARTAPMPPRYRCGGVSHLTSPGTSCGCRDGGARLGGVDHLPVQSSKLMQGAGRLDAQGGVHSARPHRVEPGCRDEPLDRGGSLVVIGRVEQHRAG